MCRSGRPLPELQSVAGIRSTDAAAAGALSSHYHKDSTEQHKVELKRKQNKDVFETPLIKPSQVGVAELVQSVGQWGGHCVCVRVCV